MEAMRQSWSDDRLDRLNEKVDLLDRRFDQVDRRLDQIDRRLDQTDVRLERVETAVTRMDERQSQISLLVVLTLVVGFTANIVAVFAAG